MPRTPGPEPEAAYSTRYQMQVVRSARTYGASPWELETARKPSKATPRAALGKHRGQNFQTRLHGKERLYKLLGSHRT